AEHLNHILRSRSRVSRPHTATTPASATPAVRPPAPENRPDPAQTAPDRQRQTGTFRSPFPRGSNTRGGNCRSAATYPPILPGGGSSFREDYRKRPTAAWDP